MILIFFGVELATSILATLRRKKVAGSFLGFWKKLSLI